MLTPAQSFILAHLQASGLEVEHLKWTTADSQSLRIRHPRRVAVAATVRLITSPVTGPDGTTITIPTGFHITHHHGPEVLRNATIGLESLADVIVIVSTGNASLRCGQGQRSWLPTTEHRDLRANCRSTYKIN